MVTSGSIFLILEFFTVLKLVHNFLFVCTECHFNCLGFFCSFLLSLNNSPCLFFPSLLLLLSYSIAGSRYFSGDGSLLLMRFGVHVYQWVPLLSEPLVPCNINPIQPKHSPSLSLLSSSSSSFEMFSLFWLLLLPQLPLVPSILPLFLFLLLFRRLLLLVLVFLSFLSYPHLRPISRTV